MESRNRIAILGAALLLTLAGSAPAGAQSSSAIQYAPGPLPEVTEPRYAQGPAREFAPGLPPSTRRALTGSAGKQLRVVATAPQFGAPNGSPVPEGNAGPDLLGIVLLIAAIAIVTALLALLTRDSRRMGPLIGAVILVAVAAAGVAAFGPGSDPGRNIPEGFFGIAPQSVLALEETERMEEAGITSIRVPVPWSTVQPSGPDSFDWRGLDQVTSVAARSGLEIFPFLYSTPAWVAPTYTRLPIDTAEQESAWQEFLRAAAERYGPGGAFWEEHGPESAEPLPETPIRNWQIWNEANFFYFANPASPERYGRLLLLSRDPIKEVDPEANIVLSGLFASPREEPPRALDAATFLRRLYRVEGVGSYFDTAALHPYAANTDDLARLTYAFRNEMYTVGDGATPLWITEMGWGSGDDTAFEKGVAGQADQLDAAYTHLLANRRYYGLERTYWFSWKDDAPPFACNFCDSVGLFEAGEGLRPKPAWFRFTEITGGDP